MAELLRQIRKTLVFGGLRVGMELARRADGGGAVETCRTVLTGVLRLAWPIRARLARNMKLAGVYRPGLVNAAFDRALDQMMMLAHVFQAGFPASGCLERFKFDSSVRFLEQAYAAGKGVINIAPHLCGYPIYPQVITPRVPCSIYLRRNKDPRKMRITEALAVAGDGHLVYPPAGASRAQRLQVAIDILRQGRVLFVTPDTPRKASAGVEVSVFGRPVHFPTGVFVMSLRTGAPVVATHWHWADGAYHIRYEEPIVLARGRRLRQQAEDATRQWARSVDAHLHEYPEMWWNWLDKRWTQILRNGRLGGRRPLDLSAPSGHAGPTGGGEGAS